MAVFISSSEGETFRWAEEYAKTLRPGDTVLLDGEMGAGKTAVAKGIAKGLGISEEVTSPTYAYINSYEGRLYHFDCYRITSERQAEELGFADYFDLGGICLVEWSENIAGLLPEQVKRVRIRKCGDTRREIEF
ncbi:MAG TPA: tRNA (adenosine(37)-N6)-threonylcarbamoyltransferase complex ATPase subunit type 1 TsaE [Candidatus Gallimonas intestinavium]|uniref:tRNA threonylcarbamoyladenosine biosynthesis protein TsaE n=1 Tax=Candidatus Gallimonas intestinavium TaxID=2838603 RepID=A0A9D2G4X8_9FIRM|nr:tRNA (adenosine(37)-N6)-threonylcarbamoyltransferase complex ATPase subunit type 1 TsaE [Candidatus Gallimonas intestinavium]